MEQEHVMTGYPSIDKPWLKYFKEDDLNEELPKRTVYQSIYINNKDYLKDDAINYFGNKISYEKLFNNTDCCTKSLRMMGVKQGDCVALCTAGIPEAIYISLACSRIGAIANFINPLFSKEQMVDRVNETNAEYFFVLDEMFHFIEDSLDSIRVNNIIVIPVTNSLATLVSKTLYLKSKAHAILKAKRKSKKYYSYNDFIKLGTTFDNALDVKYVENTPVVMVYSSGTTGDSKGILLTNESINAIIQNYKRLFKKTRTDTFLSMIPVWFSTGIILSLIMPIAHGVCVIPEPVFSKESFAKDLMKYKPTLTLTATSLWIYVATAEETRNIDLSKMIYPCTGGEKITEKDEIMLNNFLRAHGCKVLLQKGYGMCELGSAVTGTTATDGYEAKICSTGYPILNSIVSAFDIETDRELEYGEYGEIRVLSPARMKGYYKNPVATKAFFKIDDQGREWGCTGDIGYVDEDGEVFILGRASDHYRGEDGKIIYLFNIEDVILKDEAVTQCKVVDTEIDGKPVLVSHIVFKDKNEDTDSTLARIVNNLKSSLPDYMIPKYYKIRQSMPVHPNGKRNIDELKRDNEGLVKL